MTRNTRPWAEWTWLAAAVAPWDVFSLRDLQAVARGMFGEEAVQTGCPPRKQKIETYLTSLMKRGVNSGAEAWNDQLRLSVGGNISFEITVVYLYSNQPRVQVQSTLEAILGEAPYWLYGYLTDYEHYFWQNEIGPEMFEFAGKPVPPTKRVWGQEEVDISQNPGRQTWDVGYTAVVAPTMYFGKGFEAISGGCLAELGDLGRTDQCLDGRFTRFDSKCERFTTVDRTEREMQHRLRDVLFPHATETEDPP